MNEQPNRLPADGGHKLAGSGIDRSRPLRFQLDGHVLHGFAGDTVLSAALASGVIEAGTRGRRPLALDQRLAPPILLRQAAGDPAKALPMERTPALDGLDLVTLAATQRGAGLVWLDHGLALLPGRRHRLGVRYDGDGSIVAPWLDLAPTRQFTADLTVVGGGLAGMAAAVAAARHGQRVVLIERRQTLGGDARFFGGTEHENPAELIGQLVAAIAGLDQITVLTGSEAFALFEGVVRINQVEIADGVPVSRGATVSAPRIVVANGVIERLPVFAGNRRPGVVGSLDAFERAQRFGVWIGQRAMLATATSPAYRVATEAHEAGIAVERIADTRLDPQSRAIEFSKAAGIMLLRAMRPQAARAPEHGVGVTASFDTGLAGSAATQSFTVDQLLVSGGWQPDLTLWHMAGGASRWNATRTRLEAEGSLPGIMLAGAVAGFGTATACICSGEAAVALLFGRSAPAVADAETDPAHEAPDDATPVAGFDGAAADEAFLDDGTSFARRPAPRPARLLRWPGRDAARRLGEHGRPLGVADVAAGVQLGLIPAAEAAIVAQERGITHGDLIEAGVRQAPDWPDAAPDEEPPAFLAGRFGPKPAQYVVEAGDGRNFEVGCLVYGNADHADPLAAIGVVFAKAPGGRSGGLALVTKRAANTDERVTVRDISGAVAARLIDPTASPATTATAGESVAPPPALAPDSSDAPA